MITQSTHFSHFEGTYSTFSHQVLLFFPLQKKMRILLREFYMQIHWAKDKRFPWQWFIIAFSLQRLFSHRQYSIHRRLCFLFSFFCLEKTLSSGNMDLKMPYLHKEIIYTHCEQSRERCEAMLPNKYKRPGLVSSPDWIGEAGRE